MSAFAWASVLGLWVGLAWMEWRRADRARRGWRLAAVTLAVGALVALSDQWGSSRTTGEAEAVLWTAQATGAGDGVAKGQRFALPDAKGAPVDAVVVPDVAYLRRTFPEITTLEIRGDGVAPDEVAALAGLHVRFRAGGIAAGFTSVDAPTEIAPGENVRVRGRVIGMMAGKNVIVTLEGPDGAVVTSTSVVRAGGEADFDLVAPPAPTVGRFEWRLRLAAAEAPELILEQDVLGVAVVAPVLPRVLLLESAPRMDTARLRAWFAAMGGRWVSRTLVSKDRYRFAGSTGEVGEFGVLDEKLIAGYDVVLTDGATLAALSEVERKLVREAVTEKGLGVGLVADDTVLTAAQGGAGVTTDDFFMPWRLAAVGDGDAASNGRRVRLQGPAGSVLPVEPVAVGAFEIKAGPEQTVWLRDGQARALAAAVRRGRGWVALSLVTDTWRWRQGERPAAFAEYWSWYLRELAPAETAKGRWALAKAWPRVDHAVRLRWTGNVEGTPAPATVKTDGDATESRVALAQDRLESARWAGDFWPRRAGWHRVAGEAGAELDFWVNSPESWSGMSAQAKRDATGRLAAETPSIAPLMSEGSSTGLWSNGLLLVVFVGGAGYLWWESRSSRRG